MKVGVIGAGGNGRSHALTLAKIEGVEVACVCDVDEARASALAHEVNAVSFTDYEDLVRSDVEAVWICTPDFTHPQVAIAAAKAGKHIFCEKPLSIKLEDALAMVEAVRKAGVNNMVGYVLRFHPLWRRMKEIYESGRLGDLVSVWIRRFMPWFPRDWYNDPEKSGGIAVDFSTHDLDWLGWIGGAVKSAYGRTARVGTKVENDVWAILTFVSGATGVVGDSFIASIGGHCMGIVGTEGTAIVEGDGEIRLRLRDGEEERIRPEDKNPTLEEDRYFIQCVQLGQPAEPDFGWGQHVLAISLAICESARTGEAQLVPPPH